MKEDVYFLKLNNINISFLKGYNLLRLMLRLAIYGPYLVCAHVVCDPHSRAAEVVLEKQQDQESHS